MECSAKMTILQGPNEHVLNSPFTGEPACVSPNIITNWNVQLGGINVYPNPVTFGYELYLNEMSWVGLGLGCLQKEKKTF